MKKKKQKNLIFAILMTLIFVLWTLAVICVDVRAIGPNGSKVGFSTVNAVVHSFTGVNHDMYVITDLFGLVPIFAVLGFALLGLIQGVRRRSLFKVDKSIYVLGGFYAAVAAMFVLFEVFEVNYRPILINDVLETSYPSSTTLMVLCVMLGSLVELKSRIKSTWLNKTVSVVIYAFVAFMIAGRIISGVHWISDIIGGVLLSCALILYYLYVRSNIENTL